MPRRAVYRGSTGGAIAVMALLAACTVGGTTESDTGDAQTAPTDASPATPEPTSSSDPFDFTAWELKATETLVMGDRGIGPATVDLPVVSPWDSTGATDGVGVIGVAALCEPGLEVTLTYEVATEQAHVTEQSQATDQAHVTEQAQGTEQAQWDNTAQAQWDNTASVACNQGGVLWRQTAHVEPGSVPSVRFEIEGDGEWAVIIAESQEKTLAAENP